MTKKPKPKTVEIVQSDYQPTKSELPAASVVLLRGRERISHAASTRRVGSDR